MVARILPAFFLALLPAYGQNPDIAKYSYKTNQTTVVGESTNCSATAIGPYALLTASHCEAPTSTITITHKIGGPEPETVKIVRVIRDEEDHTIYFLEGNTPFKDIAQFRTPTNPVPGMQVFMVGAPADQGPLYRVGIYSGPGAEDEKGWEMFSMTIGHGDSGAAIFDKDGKIGWVLSDAEDASPPRTPPSVIFAATLPLKFDAASLKRAREFKPASAADTPKPHKTTTEPYQNDTGGMIEPDWEFLQTN